MFKTHLNVLVYVSLKHVKVKGAILGPISVHTHTHTRPNLGELGQRANGTHTNGDGFIVADSGRDRCGTFNRFDILAIDVIFHGK